MNSSTADLVNGMGRLTLYWEVPKTTPRVHPPFREPRFNIGLDFRKTIAVQRSLMHVTKL